MLESPRSGSASGDLDLDPARAVVTSSAAALAVAGSEHAARYSPATSPQELGQLAEGGGNLD